MFESWPFTNFHDLNLDWIIATMKKWNAKLTELFEGSGLYDFVEKVLKAHPEWTTTVQDGAITKTKINTSFLKEIENGYITPDQFEGDTDTAKVQAAFNYLQDGGNLVINRMYNITEPITITSELLSSTDAGNSKRCSVIGLGDNAGFTINTSTGFRGGAADVGGIFFHNLKFYGNHTNNLFDAANLYHLYFEQCVFENAENAFNVTSGHVQNLYASQCYFNRCSHGLYTNRGLWAVDITDCTFENGDTFIVTDADQLGGETIARNLNINKCVIEDCNREGLILNGHLYAVNVNACYFENNNNGSHDISIDTGPLSLTGNYFEGVFNTGRVHIPATTINVTAAIIARCNRVPHGDLVDNSNAALQFIDVDPMGGHAVTQLVDNTKNINENATRYITVSGTGTTTAADTPAYTGISITVPSYTEYNLMFRARFDTVRANAISVNTNTADHWVGVLADSGSTRSGEGTATCSLTGYTGQDSLTMYVWVRYEAAGSNNVTVQGTYKSKLPATYLD